jgi:hypothetical protein
MTTAQPDLQIPPVPPVSYQGFVVAMRAKLLGTPRLAMYEWIIVSRWGNGGDHLSISWTSLPGRAGVAPIHLVPRHTAVAVRQDPFPGRAPATFVLTAALPEGMTVAGDFLPARGYVRLYGSGTRLRVRSKGQSLKPDIRSAWRIVATRQAWIGEFIEGAPQSTGRTAKADDCCAGDDLMASIAKNWSE